MANLWAALQHRSDMNTTTLLILCAIFWGLSTFLQKLSSDNMSPLLMQVVTGVAFIFCIPILIKMSGGIGNLKWNTTSIVLTFVATLIAILGNISLYTALSNNKHTGSSAMFIALYPVVTLLLSACFLHEQFTSGKIIGILAMIGGACLLTFC